MVEPRRVRVGVIGAGGRHGRFHMDMVLALRDELELAVLCERDRARLAAAAACAGPEVRATRRIREVLREAPDMVIVATPTHQGAPVCEALLEAGIPVLTEVPPAYCDARARRMLEIAEQKQVPFGAFENYVFTPIEQLKQQAIQAGVFGRIQCADIAGSVSHKGHEVAVARGYLPDGAQPVRARALGFGIVPHASEGIEIPATLSGSVEFDCGSEVRFFFSGWDPRGPHVPIGGLRRDFFGTQGGYWDGRFQLGTPDHPSGLRQIPLRTEVREVDSSPVLQELVLESDHPICWKSPFASRPLPWAEQLPSFQHVDATPRAWEIACAELLLDMANAVRTRSSPRYSVQRSMADVRIRLAMLESARRAGTWVRWEETLPIEEELARTGLRELLKRFDFRPLPTVTRQSPSIPHVGVHLSRDEPSSRS